MMKRGFRLPKQHNPRTVAGRVTSVLVLVLAGLLITVAAVAARGTDLRSDRNLSLRELITQQGQRNTQLESEIAQVRADIEQLQTQNGDLVPDQSRLEKASRDAEVLPMSGPGLHVELMDAPNDVKPAGVSDDALVVHQQDIQAVVNALWAGGAEAMSIQGVRIISTTAVKCVGNTVVLHGVPYAPPYVIEAIGDQDRMREALNESPAINIYRQYVTAYGLGYSVEASGNLDLAGFTGSLGIQVAQSE